MHGIKKDFDVLVIELSSSWYQAFIFLSLSSFSP